MVFYYLKTPNNGDIDFILKKRAAIKGAIIPLIFYDQDNNDLAVVGDIDLLKPLPLGCEMATVNPLCSGMSQRQLFYFAQINKWRESKSALPMKCNLNKRLHRQRVLDLIATLKKIILKKEQTDDKNEIGIPPVYL